MYLDIIIVITMITIIIFCIDMIFIFKSLQRRSDIPNIRINFELFQIYYYSNLDRYNCDIVSVLMKDGDYNNLSDKYMINLFFGNIDTIRYIIWKMQLSINIYLYNKYEDSQRKSKFDYTNKVKSLMNDDYEKSDFSINDIIEKANSEK